MLIEDLALTRATVRVELEDIGEGWGGDFQPDDPNDQPLYRFTVSQNIDGLWEQVDDASYCTGLIVGGISFDEGVDFLRKVMASVFDAVNAGESIKRTCEEFSWAGVR